MIASTPSPPYYAVIFTSIRSNIDNEYAKTAERMVELAQAEEGFLGFESARDKIGISVSYWKDLNSIKQWKNNMEHMAAREKGRTEWYKSFRIRIAKVEREYGMEY